MKKKIICLALASIMILALFAGCTQKPEESPAPATPSTTPSEPSTPSEAEKIENPLIKDRDTLVIAMEAEVNTLDRFRNTTIPTNELLYDMYDTILETDEEGNIIPNVCESWEWDADDLTYTFTLRKDVKFHNGRLATSEDLAFTYERIRDEPAVAHYGGSFIDTVEIIDDYSVKVKLTGPSAVFLYCQTINGTLYPKDEFIETEEFKDTIIACGPYKFVEYQVGQQLVMERFEDYWGEKPAIKNVIFKIIPDSNTQLIAAESGEINIAKLFPMNAIENLNENLEYYGHPCGQICWLMLNEMVPEFQNEKVRQAINYCIDKEFIIEAAEEGAAVPANSIAHRDMFGYTEEAKMYEYDVEKAKQLMAEAGYPDGFTTGPIIVRENKQKRVAEIVLENLRAIGIESSIEIVESNVFQPLQSSGNYTMGITVNNLFADVDHAANFVVDGHTSNRIRHNDPVLNEMIAESRVELDREKREKLLNDIVIRMSDTAATVPLYYPTRSLIITKGLKILGYNKFVGILPSLIAWSE